MSTYTIIHNGTGEIMREVTSEQLQAADKLLKLGKRLGLHSAATSHATTRDRVVRYGSATRHPAGYTKHRTYKPKRESIWNAAIDLGLLVVVGGMAYVLLDILG